MVSSKYLTKILLIEDNKPLSLLIRKHLQENNKSVNIQSSGKKGLKEAFTNKYELILLDIGLPDMSGQSILKTLREEKNRTPCIIITNHTSFSDEINSYKNGANLFHKKPLSMPLLNVQIDRLLKISPDNKFLLVKDLAIDLNKRLVYLDKKPTNLTQTEYNLLLLLMETNGRTLSRSEIIANILNYNKDIQYSSVDTMISRLRKKLKGTIIDTVIGVGYRMNREYLKEIHFENKLVNRNL